MYTKTVLQKITLLTFAKIILYSTNKQYNITILLVSEEHLHFAKSTKVCTQKQYFKKLHNTFFVKKHLLLLC